MENKTNWWMIVGIVVVVAVVASLVTLQFTGNVVRVINTDKTKCINSCVAEKCAGLNSKTSPTLTSCKRSCSSSCTKAEVYTKAEVDALLANVYCEKNTDNVNATEAQIIWRAWATNGPSMGAILYNESAVFFAKKGSWEEIVIPRSDFDRGRNRTLVLDGVQITIMDVDWISGNLTLAATKGILIPIKEGITLVGDAEVERCQWDPTCNVNKDLNLEFIVEKTSS